VERIRLEIVEDLPSPAGAGDMLTMSPPPSIEHLPPAPQELTVTSADRLLSSSPFPIASETEAMIALRGLFPELSNLVRVTLVPPRRARHSLLLETPASWRSPSASRHVVSRQSTARRRTTQTTRRRRAHRRTLVKLLDLQTLQGN